MILMELYSGFNKYLRFNVNVKLIVFLYIYNGKLDIELRWNIIEYVKIRYI